LMIPEWSTSEHSIGYSEAGAKLYRTAVPLDVPSGLDVPLGLKLSSPTGPTVRVQLYVDLYMFGKYVPYIGNHVVFLVFPNSLSYRGNNTIALSVWAQEEIGGSVRIGWTVLGVVASAFDPGFDAEYLRPGWGVEGTGGDKRQYY